MKQGSLDYWRNYFRGVNSDIFGIIDHAMMVAASDCPKEFRLRRDRIAERLFSCTLTRCSGCNGVELAVPGHDGDGESDGCKTRDGSNNGGGGDVRHDDDDHIEIDIEGGCEFEHGVGSKESNANSCNNGELNMNGDQMVSNYSYGEAEALTDEIEEETQIVGEVLRIKDILQASQEESDSLLFESLRRLELMALTVDILKATEIGKTVNVLRRHGSVRIRQLAQTLIVCWKDLVDEWCNATEAVKGDEGTPESVNPSVVEEEEEEEKEEEGLPFPPLDEMAFFATQPTSMELSQFFDGLDDYGNPRSGGEFNKDHDKGRKPSIENQNITKKQTTNEENVVAEGNKSELVKRQVAPMKPGKPLNNDSGPGRPRKTSVENNASNQLKSQTNSEKITNQRKPSVQQDKIKCSEEAAVHMKLEATKRKLQESYQQVENAKRQRTIQVMDLQDLPKQGHHKNPHGRHGNNNRHWAHGRR
ncbi:hypothetical protein K2173_010819 [Erythroxylum novogranatense]|uniref:TFIIS N-terminal domain-containing protein n=1 Tax=Erythroxylum novogranatense TaxID=1862640 RepID=A0AAV8T111_9ROSI|nr:hypothetical protein K2173_010819 [Erythroxylum novogranatense]